MRNTWFKSGDYNALCDVCGFKFKASELKERWDGRRVCAQDFDFRHPLDFAKQIRPEPVLPWTRPEPDDVFVDANFCTPSGRQGVAGFGQAGCAVVGYDANIRE